MSNIKSCSIVLEGKKELYRPGECVKGEVYLDVVANLNVKGVRIYFFGEALTKWKDVGSRESRFNYGTEKYFGLVTTVFGNAISVEGKIHTLVVGCHGFTFNFSLPNYGLPSSYEGEHGAIRYWIKVEIQKPFLCTDKSYTRCITLIDDIDVNLPDFQIPVEITSRKTVSKALGIGNAGEISISASTDRSAYCAGEKIALNVFFKNDTSKNMGNLKAYLMQSVLFMGNGDEKSTESIICGLEDVPLLKGEERRWDNLLLSIEAIPPSTRIRSCHVISVKYFVQVTVVIPLGLNLDARLPVTIGTIPYRYPETGRPPQGDTAEAVQPPVITHMQCTKGFQVCTKSHRNMEDLFYIPMCVCVLNYLNPAGPDGSEITKSLFPLSQPAIATSPLPHDAVVTKATEAGEFPAPTTRVSSVELEQPQIDPPPYDVSVRSSDATLCTEENSIKGNEKSPTA